MNGQPLSGPGNRKRPTTGRRPAGAGVFFNRSPIIDFLTHTCAQQLEFVQIAKADGRPRPVTPSSVSVCAFLDTLEIRSLASGRSVFVKADAEIFDKLSAARDWKDNIVFDIDLGEPNHGEILAFVEFLRRKQASYCLGNMASGDQAGPLLSPGCFLKVEVTDRTEEDLRTILESLKGAPVKTIATAVETREKFDACSRLGFKLFHGGFFKEAVALTKGSVSPNHALLLDLSRRIARGEDIKSIEEVFKKSPDLTFGLFNLARSAYFRASNDLTSIKQAIALLGYKDLQKWAALMLFSVSHSDSSENPLFEAALTRARTMETAASTQRGKGFSDAAYMVGIFSLVPALFNVSMEEIAESANFGEEIREALLKGAGRLGAMLDVVKGIEGAAYEECVERVEEAGIGLERFFAARATALMEFSALACPEGESTGEPGESAPLFAKNAPSSRPEPELHATLRTSWFGKLLNIFHHS
jgi:EAL and modified HD-GYP domain-containing signal transduction protein